MTVYFSTFATPLGDFSVGVDADAAVVATAFGDAARLGGRIGAPTLQRDDAPTAEARRQLESYFADPRTAFSLVLRPAGSAFQQRVWRALRAIPCGATRSYGELAKKLNSSARAVGRANATNPICVIVPCHRVIGADGALTGFAFGTALKQALLRHEQSSSADLFRLHAE